MRRAAGVALLLLPLWSGAATAAPQRPAPAPEPDVPEKAGKILRAARVAGSPPVIDGRLDDEVWTAADSIADFVQNEPDNMADASERTVVQIAYDDRYIYVAARCNTDRGAPTTGLGRRDDELATDQFLIGFDPRHDHQTAYVFGVNPSGVQRDFSVFDDTERNNDYDAVWEVVTQVAPDGWTAEYRIPFSQMRFDIPDVDEVVWGLQVERDIHARREQTWWVPTPRGAIGVVSRFGHLRFDGPLKPARRIEVLPFVLARSDDRPSARVEYGVTGGVDLRVGLGTGATLAATVNPDFGQVEQDPAVLNLTVFETFFPEKRPFFLEDSRVFVPQFEQFQLFHSRRIGAGDTTILGAAKLVNRGATWSYGALTALTGAEPAAGLPRTAHSVGRLQREVLNGSSNVGILTTAVLREAATDAFAGGLDYNLRWRGNRLFWNGHWAATRADRAGRMRTGLGGLTNAGHYGKHVGTALRYERYGRDFDVDDLGFHRHRVDKTDVEGRLLATQPDPWGPFRFMHTYLNVGQRWNGDDLLLWRRAQTGLNVTFRNYWDVFSWIGRTSSAFDDLDTRGGPPIVDPGEWYGGVFIATDARNTWRAHLMISTAHGVGGRDVEVAPAVTLQPSGRFRAAMGAVFQPAERTAQWIANRDTDGDGEIDHVYGRLRQKLFDVNVRTTYAFSRDLTLQAYVQPFVAIGDYSDARRLARPRSFDFEPTELSLDPDFDRRSLRSNVVLRWEYIRGSTLFVVWNTQAVAGEASHVAMMKVSYWLGR
jgi:hypothetical protein